MLNAGEYARVDSQSGTQDLPNLDSGTVDRSPVAAITHSVTWNTWQGDETSVMGIVVNGVPWIEFNLTTVARPPWGSGRLVSEREVSAFTDEFAVRFVGGTPPSFMQIKLWFRES